MKPQYWIGDVDVTIVVGLLVQIDAHHECHTEQQAKEEAARIATEKAIGHGFEVNDTSIYAAEELQTND